MFVYHRRACWNVLEHEKYEFVQKRILKMHIVYPCTLKADQKIHTLSKISYPAFQPISFLGNQQNQLICKKLLIKQLTLASFSLLRLSLTLGGKRKRWLTDSQDRKVIESFYSRQDDWYGMVDPWKHIAAETEWYWPLLSQTIITIAFFCLLHNKG